MDDVQETSAGHSISIGDELELRHAWGAAWSQDGLDERARIACAIASLIMLGNRDELRLHMAAAIRNGHYSRDELGEIVLHAAGYAGYAVALAALGTLPEEE